MNLSTLTDVLALHGYGIYVWPAYVAALACVAVFAAIGAMLAN